MTPALGGASGVGGARTGDPHTRRRAVDNLFADVRAHTPPGSPRGCRCGGTLHRPVRAVHPVALPAPSEDLLAA